MTRKTATKADLTPRQKRVLELSRKGKKPAEIAGTLRITPNAVQQHLRRIKDKGIAVPESNSGRKTRKTRKSNARSRKQTARRTTPVRRSGLPSAGDTVEEISKVIKNTITLYDREIEEAEAEQAQLEQRATDEAATVMALKAEREKIEATLPA